MLRCQPILPARLAHVVSVPDAVKSFDLREIFVNVSELAAKAFDVAVDGAVVNIYILAIGGVD